MIFIYLLLNIIIIPSYLTILKMYYDVRIINSVLYSMIMFLSGICIYTYFSFRMMSSINYAVRGGIILYIYLFGLLILYFIYLLNILLRNDFKIKNYSKNEKRISILILLSLLNCIFMILIGIII
jgi:hypothetical protein